MLSYRAEGVLWVHLRYVTDEIIPCYKYKRLIVANTCFSSYNKSQQDALFLNFIW